MYGGISLYYSDADKGAHLDIQCEEQTTGNGPLSPSLPCKIFCDLITHFPMLDLNTTNHLIYKIKRIAFCKLNTSELQLSLLDN